MKKLRTIRNDQELATLQKIGALQAMSNFTWQSTPFLVSCATFTVFVLSQNRPLTTDLVFPALTLFNMLAFPLAVLPILVSAIVEASVAVNRLTSFLTAEEVQHDAVLRKPTIKEDGKETIRVRDATFTWKKADSRYTLKNINFSAKKGQLTCVVGRVGCGKSSLLQAVLGDLWKVCGEVVVHGNTAYVSQQPWIMNATVKENIVFGHRWDPKFYESTVRACALLEDFQSLPDGDRTEVGERGISLSGGQKARLALARAVYARADNYLLDDVLAAVDQHVGRHLIENVLGTKGLLGGKTRVLATNSIPVLKEADFIILLRDGSIVEQGAYSQLINMNSEVASLIRTSNNQDDGRGNTPEGDESEQSSTTAESGTGQEEGEAQEVQEAQEEVAQLVPIITGEGRPRKSSLTTLRRASTASFRGPRGKRSDEEEAKGSARTQQGKEFSEQGKVKWKVYAEYAKNSNIPAVTFYLLTLIGAQTGQVGMYILSNIFSKVKVRRWGLLR